MRGAPIHGAAPEDDQPREPASRQNRSTQTRVKSPQSPTIGNKFHATEVAT